MNDAINRHALILLDRSDAGSVLICAEPDCGREILLSRTAGFKVISKGDPYALHHSGVALDIDAGPER